MNASRAGSEEKGFRGFDPEYPPCLAGSFPHKGKALMFTPAQLRELQAAITERQEALQRQARRYARDGKDQAKADALRRVLLLSSVLSEAKQLSVRSKDAPVRS